jgi:hypothetical protein
MALQNFERETSLWYSDETKTALVYTCNRALINKMDKLCKHHPDTYKLKRVIKDEGNIVGKEYTCPKRLISIRSPRTKKYTDEQRKAMGEKLRNKQQKSK